jgi:hypothetical protein
MSDLHRRRDDVPATHAESTASGASIRSRFQISLTLILLLMIVFAFLSAALFYASQVPGIREEISILFGGEANGGGEDVGRLAHRAFILFTFTSPLLLACVLSTTLSVLNYFQRKAN